MATTATKGLRDDFRDIGDAIGLLIDLALRARDRFRVQRAEPVAATSASATTNETRAPQ